MKDTMDKNEFHRHESSIVGLLQLYEEIKNAKDTSYDKNFTSDQQQKLDAIIKDLENQLPHVKDSSYYTNRVGSFLANEFANKYSETSDPKVKQQLIQQMLNWPQQIKDSKYHQDTIVPIIQNHQKEKNSKR